MKIPNYKIRIVVLRLVTRSIEFDKLKKRRRECKTLVHVVFNVEHLVIRIRLTHLPTSPFQLFKLHSLPLLLLLQYSRIPPRTAPHRFDLLIVSFN